MNFHLKKSRLAKLLLTITTSIVLVFVVNQAQAKSLKKGEIYSSLDAKQVVEVISENELEITIKEDIILANYNFKDGKVRIVYTEAGTRKVAYYEIIEEGLRDRKGKILYSKAAKLKVEAARLKMVESAVFYDKKTGLEWLAGPDKATNWYDAKKWVESLTAVAGGGWRMPTMKELKALYKMGAGKRNMTPLLKTTGWQVWSGETMDSSAPWGFGFGSGFVALDNRAFSSNRRGFAVRSRR